MLSGEITLNGVHTDRITGNINIFDDGMIAVITYILSTVIDSIEVAVILQIVYDINLVIWRFASRHVAVL